MSTDFLRLISVFAAAGFEGGFMHTFSTAEIQDLIFQGEISKFYKSKAWQRLARRVIADHHGECFLCREKKKLTRAVLVHHVRPVKQFPELAYSRTYLDTDGEHIQLMPLCFDCHERIHGRGRYAKPRGYENEEKW